MPAGGAGDPNTVLAGIALLVTACAGFLGAVAGLVVAVRRPKKRDGDDDGDDDEERHRLWQEILERLDASDEERADWKRKYEACNRERLRLLRERRQR